MGEVEMKKAMRELEKKDPEFFRYLKENDRELLSFGEEGRAVGKGKRKAQSTNEGTESVNGSEDEADEVVMERRKTSVTMRMLRQWQQGMLKVSL